MVTITRSANSPDERILSSTSTNNLRSASANEMSLISSLQAKNNPPMVSDHHDNAAQTPKIYTEPLRWSYARQFRRKQAFLILMSTSQISNEVLIVEPCMIKFFN